MIIPRLARSARTRTAVVRTAMLLVVAAAGCEALTGPDGDEAEMERRQRQWSAQGLADYDFVMRHECFCAYGGMPIRVEVRGDTVRAQFFVETGAEIPATQEWPRRRTIEGLFTVLEDAFDRNAARIDATYDDALGYPRTTFIDYHENVADEEYGWTIVSLTPR